MINRLDTMKVHLDNIDILGIRIKSTPLEPLVAHTPDSRLVTAHVRAVVVVHLGPDLVARRIVVPDLVAVHGLPIGYVLYGVVEPEISAREADEDGLDEGGECHGCGRL